jgi:hypothetical protein
VDLFVFLLRASNSCDDLITIKDEVRGLTNAKFPIMTLFR